MVVLGGATLAGAYQGGLISFAKAKPPVAATVATASARPVTGIPAKPAATAHVPTVAEKIAAAVPAKPIAPPKEGTFVVSSISLGQPSIAIINGQSRVQGDPVEAAGVTGWTVSQITEDAVVLRNGVTLASIPLATPGIKPLNDELHPLN